MNFLAYGEWSDIFSSADAASSLWYDNLDYCGYEETIKDIMNKCASSEEACSLNTLWTNTYTNYFNIFSIITSMTDIILHPYALTSDELYEKSFEVGKDIGLLLAVIFGL